MLKNLIYNIQKGETMSNTIDNFMEIEEIACLIPKSDNKDNWGKCDVCNLDSEVYNCSGYSQKERYEKVGYKICHECLLTLNYGE